MRQYQGIPYCCITPHRCGRYEAIRVTCSHVSEQRFEKSFCSSHKTSTVIRNTCAVMPDHLPPYIHDAGAVSFCLSSSETKDMCVEFPEYQMVNKISCSSNLYRRHFRARRTNYGNMIVSQLEFSGCFEKVTSEMRYQMFIGSGIERVRNGILNCRFVECCELGKQQKSEI